MSTKNVPMQSLLLQVAQARRDVGELWQEVAPGEVRRNAVAVGVVLILTYILGYVFYNIYFHPLAKYPGPFLARSSLLWRMIYSMRGRFHRAIDAQHKKYGPVFRVSPNELSFASVGSWQGIYGHPTAGRQTHIKSAFYDIFGSGYDTLCVGSERNPRRHATMRKSLSAAFATRALVEQEDIVQGCVDTFVEKIGSVEGAATTGLNMTKWYEMVSFDILGEMAFGESFHAVENEEPHFWSELILGHLFFVTVMDNLRRYPLLLALGKAVLPWATTAIRDKHTGYTRNQVQKRLESDVGRKDFMSNLVAKLENGEIQKEEMTAHASTLVIAGGETTSTFLGAVTYYLLKTPSAYAKLQSEIRSAFESYDNINATVAQQLPYLQAVIAEGLRIYPPGSQGFPRVSPGSKIDGYWVPKGTDVYTSAWTVTHDPKYFHDPFDFIPERWIDPECGDVKEASQPFSLGPRGCLGRNFAFVEMNLILSKMLYRYDMELVDPNLDWEGSSHMHVMWWKPELRVRFLPREHVGMGMVMKLKTLDI